MIRNSRRFAFHFPSPASSPKEASARLSRARNSAQEGALLSLLHMPPKRPAGLLSRRGEVKGGGKTGDNAIDDDDAPSTSSSSSDSGRSSSPHPLDAAVASRHSAPDDAENEKKKNKSSRDDERKKTKAKKESRSERRRLATKEEEEEKEEVILLGSSSSSDDEEEEPPAKKAKNAKKSGERRTGDEPKAEAEAEAAALLLPRPTGVVVVPDGAPRAGSDAVRRLLRPARYFNSSNNAGATGKEGENPKSDNGSGEALLEAALEAADAGRSCWRCGGGGHIARECPLGPAPKPCHLCGQLGHARFECPNGKRRRFVFF